jgi:hypothetical protein
MTDIIRLRDHAGVVHFTARDSQAAERLLRDGAVDLDAPPADTPGTDTTDTEAEVTDAGSTGQGEDHDTGTTSGGSGKRQRAARTADRGDGRTGEV